MGIHDPAEPEQLVLKIVEVASAIGRLDKGQHGQLLDRIGQVNRR